MATAGIARCKTTGAATAGTLVKIGALGAVTNAASTDSLIFGRAITDAASGSAYILLNGTAGFDRAIDVFPSFPDSTTSTALSVSPTFSMGSGATQTMFGMTPTVTGGTGELQFVRIGPAMTFSVGTTLPLINGIKFAGTLTNSAVVDEFPIIKRIFAGSCG
ncbi:MAG: hypothetical protein FJ148_24400 [Deltaproteobacteria bacterium]|nr:hypothetical protein [Deltaproteobacteria bacterium]